MVPRNASFSLAAGSRRGGLLRDLLRGAVLVSVFLSLWTFLMLGVGGPLGRLQGPAARPATAADRS